MILLITGILSPIILLVLFDSVINRHDKAINAKLALIGIAALSTCYFAIVTTGHEGPIYRVYLAVLMGIYLMLTLNKLRTENSIKQKSLFKWTSAVLVVIEILLISSPGIIN